MQGKLALATVLIAITVHSGRATAQNVYKCGSSYSQQPCAGGTAVEASDARAGTQKRQTEDAARRDARAADAMEKERLKAQAQPVPAYIPAAKGDSATAPPPQAAGKLKKPEVFPATAPAKPGDKAPKKKKDAKNKPEV